MSPPDALAVVVVAHDSAEALAGLLGPLIDQLHPYDELVVVDNASADGTAEHTRSAGERIRLVESSTNLGFGGGCHLGAQATQAPLLLFLNPDCRPEPGCLDRLRSAASERPDWGAWQAAVMLPDGHINTDGGVVHYVGIGWAGDCGRPADALSNAPREVAFPSGAALTIRREVWDELGGLDPSYFLYSEDLDLGLRLWLAGHGVGLVPDARVVHDYEFEKGAQKWFWLERNRWRTVLSVYPTRLLVLVLPALLAVELAIVAAAGRQGWLRAKLAAQRAGLMDLPRTLARRRRIQATRRTSTAEFAARLTSSLDSPFLPSAPARRATALQARYWDLVKRVI
ncbi:MAG: glycosyltransferase family 2 protein [Solirubrobacteraceae bacterium]